MHGAPRERSNGVLREQPTLVVVDVGDRFKAYVIIDTDRSPIGFYLSLIIAPFPR